MHTEFNKEQNADTEVLSIKHFVVAFRPCPSFPENNINQQDVLVCKAQTYHHRQQNRNLIITFASFTEN